MRSGILARKIGMTRVFTQDGATVPVTMLKYEPCYVTTIRTKDLDGYNAIQLATGQRKAKNVTKPMRGHFAKAKVEPQMKICEFRTDELGDVEVGGVLDITHIVAGQYVDARGFSIGKGFAGPMKRYNFGGLRASHGVSISHRSHGSTGQRQDPGRVFKGKKMAGHMGQENVVTQNLYVQDVDLDNQLILIKGSVPGAKGSYVRLTDAVKMKQKVTLPTTTAKNLKSAVDKVAEVKANEEPVVENNVNAETASQE